MLQCRDHRCQVVLEEGEGAGAQKVPLTIRGLTGSGYLCATDEGGEQYELHPDGNRWGHRNGLY
jgi:biotin--protein ligase